MDLKVKTARLSIISNLCLTVMKLAVGIFMGSLSVVSEALHSGIDLIAAVIAFLSVKQSCKPADSIHPYGHGKFENVASIIEAVLIIVTAVGIIIKSVPKFSSPGEIHSLGIGAVVMVVSVAVNFFVSQRLFKVAKKTDSPALEGDAWHLRSDIYTSLGIIAGLAAIKITGLYILDPVIAVCVSLVILKAGFDLIKKSFPVIVDERLSNEEINTINQVLRDSSVNYLEYHELRTRKAGPQRFIDVHLVFPKDLQIKEISETCSVLERQIKDKLLSADVVIKVEPCGEKCFDCRFACKYKTEVD